MKTKSLNRIKKFTINKEIDILNAKKQEIWNPDNMYWMIYSEYLNKSNKNVSISNYSLEYNAISNELRIRRTIPSFNILSYKYDSAKIRNEIIEDYLQNNKKRLFIIPITIFAGFYHQNSLLIDRKNKEAELFEPYGDLNTTMKTKYKNNNIPDIINEKLYKNIIKNFIDLISGTDKIKVYSAENFLPKRGLQFIEESECLKNVYKVDTVKGFCIIWTMYYLESRVKNPDKNRNYIIKYILNKVNEGKTDKYVCQLIRKYTLFLINLYNQKSLKSKIKINLIHKTNYYIFKLLNSISSGNIGKLIKKIESN